MFPVTVAQIGKVTVEKMVNEFGCNPKDIIVGIGPCIKECCYEVDEPVAKEFKLDSKADFTKYEEFTLGEDRYRALKKINKEGEKLLSRNKDDAEATYQYYQNLVGEKEE